MNDLVEYLRERFDSAADSLEDLASQRTGAERYRLIGKAQGVVLASTYLEDWVRTRNG